MLVVMLVAAKVETKVVLRVLDLVDCWAVVMVVLA